MGAIIDDAMEAQYRQSVHKIKMGQMSHSNFSAAAKAGKLRVQKCPRQQNAHAAQDQAFVQQFIMPDEDADSLRRDSVDHEYSIKPAACRSSETHQLRASGQAEKSQSSSFAASKPPRGTSSRTVNQANYTDLAKSGKEADVLETSSASI